VVAVLAAVSEEIKSRGGSESNTEYFAALVSLTFQLFCPYCIVPLILNVFYAVDTAVGGLHQNRWSCNC